MLNIAHRGYSPKYPENTLLAFDKAIEFGADGIELDVQLTRDGVLMVYHNEKVNDLTNHEGNIKDFTSKELREMNILDSEEYIMDLETVLERCREDGIIYNIELKNSKVKYKDIGKMELFTI